MPQTAREMCREGRQQELTCAGHARAKSLYSQAIADEPEYMPAFAEYSYVLVREYQNAWGDDRDAALDEALALANRAVALSEQTENDFRDDFRARWYRAMVHWNRGDFASSFEDFDMARRLISPERIVQDTADLDADMAEALIYYGEPEKAIDLILGAMRSYSEHPWWYRWNLARAYYQAEHYRAAIDEIDKIASPPNDLRLIRAAAMAQLGDPNAAEIMNAFMQEDPDWTVEKSAAYHYGKDATKQLWLEGLRKAGLKEK